MEKELEMHRNNLEALVKSRTKELDTANIKLTQEIEKEKKYEIMLQQALQKEKELNELKSKFISTTSHEFRTPLTSVLSSAELILRYRNNWGDEKLNHHLKKIKSSVDYLTKLLDDVLTISRSESGKINFNPIKTNLYQICSEIIEDLKSSISEKHKFKFVYSKKRKEFLLDQKLIRFMLVNLLSNAFKYSPEGGKVELNINIVKSSIIITVTDEGIGIPNDDMPYLFETFHRGKNTIEIPGTGLGLSIVQRAVNMHNGVINVESRENEGTKFIITIPIMKEKSG